MGFIYKGLISTARVKPLKRLIENRCMQLNSGNIAIVDDDTSGHQSRQIGSCIIL